MASAKIATLLIRTIAKPISSRLKDQARNHETFRSVCVSLAQFMYRSEVKLRTNLLGESPTAKHLRPLSEAKAIDNGANALAEGFLFVVAAGLILGESYRSSTKETKRREGVTDQLDNLLDRVMSLEEKIDRVTSSLEEVKGSDAEDGWEGIRRRNDELERVLQRVVEIGLRGGWAEFRNDPIQFPLVDLRPDTPPSSTSLSSSTNPAQPPSSESSNTAVSRTSDTPPS